MMLGNVHRPMHLRGQKPQTMPYPKHIADLEPHCLQCGDLIAYGRSDRKFCSPDCKNEYNNRRRHLPAREDSEPWVLTHLRANYAILRRLLIMGVHSIGQETLRQLGFRPEFVTFYKKLGHRTQFGCFDIRYEQTPSRVKKLSFTEKGLENGLNPP